MSKKNNEVKENEELKENVAKEATENETVTSTGETAEEIKGENVKAPEEESNKKNLIANTDFIDKYTGTKYEKGTEFVVIEEEIETEKIAEKKYKISAKRAKEIESKGYIG